MASPSVISNSSPLIHLSKIERLDLLQRLYKEVTIPAAVYREIVLEGHGRPGSSAIKIHCDKGDIRVREITNKNLYKSLKRDLDNGEAEAITLAVEMKADLILLDESEARKMASLFDLPVTGFIGILLKAYKNGLIDDFKTTLDKAVENGFYINSMLYQRLLNHRYG